MSYFTDFGTIDAPDQETADREAYKRWLEDGWAQGGYAPMTREEFEIEYLAGLKNFQTIKGCPHGSRGR